MNNKLETWKSKAAMLGILKYYSIQNDALVEVCPGIDQSILNMFPPVTHIGRNAFTPYSASFLKGHPVEIKLPNTVRHIHENAFTGWRDVVTNIEFNEGLETIEYEAFSNCSLLRELKFPSTLKSIGYGAFKYYRGKEVILPENIVHLGGCAFANSTNLQTVNIPDSLKYLGDHPFHNDFKIKNIKVDLRIPRYTTNPLIYTESSIINTDKDRKIDNRVDWCDKDTLLEIANSTLNIFSNISSLAVYLLYGADSMRYTEGITLRINHIH